MHDLSTNFAHFLNTAKYLLNDYLDQDGNTEYYPNKSQMSDIEVIALSVLAEALSIPSENWLFSKLKSDYSNDFPNLISRPRFNIRRRKLQPLINQITLAVANELEPNPSAHIIDSIPIPICENPRICRTKICSDDAQVMPSNGYHASHKKHYFGFKFQLIITQKGIPIAGGLFPANVHDVNALKIINEFKITDCELIADKGYLSLAHQTTLFETAKVKLITPLRNNMSLRTNLWSPDYRYKRKRIETLFSQLMDQFNLRKNFAKTIDGLMVRIVTKLAAVAMCQITNFDNNKPLNHLKHALAF